MHFDPATSVVSAAKC